MIASLAMYDLPWLRAGNDRLWAAIADHLRKAGLEDVPERLTRGGDLHDVWRAPRLLLAQSCGFPVTTERRETVQIVATPRYRAEGCEGARHRAAIVVRAGDRARDLADLRGYRLGVNGFDSNSGMNLPRAAIAPLAQGAAFFDRVVVTGAHARSFAAVLSGTVDVAAIDAVTLAHLRRRYPRRAEGLRVLAWTAPSPGLPLITAATTPPDALAALRAALDATSAEARNALLIEGFDRLDLADYQPVLALQDEATAQGYPTLR